MLLGEHWQLKNRYLIINPPDEYKEQPRLDVPTSTPASTPTSTDGANMFYTDNVNVKNVVTSLGERQMSVKELMTAVGLKDRKNFIEYSLAPAMSLGFVRMLFPESPRHPRQKYLLTVRGVGLYKQIDMWQHKHRCSHED